MLASLLGEEVLTDGTPIPCKPTKGTNKLLERWWTEPCEGKKPLRLFKNRSGHEETPGKQRT
jgi:hypothetical protein